MSSRSVQNAFGVGSPSWNIPFPDGNLTVAEILAYMPHWIKSIDVIHRFAMNGATAKTVAAIYNKFRSFPGDRMYQGNSITITVKDSMRRAGFAGWTLGTHSSFAKAFTVEEGGEWDEEDLSVAGFRTPRVTHPKAGKANLVTNREAEPVLFHKLALHVKEHPSGADALDLTACVLYAIDHPQEQWLFPTDFEALKAHLGGCKVVTPDHHDSACFQRHSGSPCQSSHRPSTKGTTITSTSLSNKLSAGPFTTPAAATYNNIPAEPYAAPSVKPHIVHPAEQYPISSAALHTTQSVGPHTLPSEDPFGVPSGELFTIPPTDSQEFPSATPYAIPSTEPHGGFDSIETYDLLTTESYYPPSTELFELPSTEAFDFPHTELFEISDTGPFGLPHTELFDFPHTEPFDFPQTELLDFPQTELCEFSNTELFEPASTEPFDLPHTEPYCSPSTRKYDLPSTEISEPYLDTDSNPVTRRKRPHSSILPPTFGIDPAMTPPTDTGDPGTDLQGGLPVREDSDMKTPSAAARSTRLISERSSQKTKLDLDEEQSDSLGSRKRRRVSTGRVLNYDSPASSHGAPRKRTKGLDDADWELQTVSEGSDDFDTPDLRRGSSIHNEVLELKEMTPAPSSVRRTPKRLAAQIASNKINEQSPRLSQPKFRKSQPEMDPELEQLARDYHKLQPVFLTPHPISRNRLCIDEWNVDLYAEEGADDVWASALAYDRYKNRDGVVIARRHAPWRDLHRLSDPAADDPSDFAENVRWAKQQWALYGSVWTEYPYSLETITEHRITTLWASEQCINHGI